MPEAPVRRHIHHERHFASSERVRDVVIGMADGLTVPFALAAGLSGVVKGAAGSRLVVIAGLAEIAAGSVAMGLGGYLAARGDLEHYQSERAREEMEVVERPRDEEEEIYEIFEEYGVSRAESLPVLEALKRNSPAYVDFMMRFELGLEQPLPGRAAESAMTIAGSYIVGGMVPLTPYMLIDDPVAAVFTSVGVTLLALFIFGGIKGRLTGTGVVRSSLQTAVIGGLAAGVAFLLAKLFNAR